MVRYRRVERRVRGLRGCEPDMERGGRGRRGARDPRSETHAASCEIHLLAVSPEWHRRGVGRQLVEAFEADAIANGFRLAQVKTLGPSHPDEGYAATRRFYAALGYLELEELTDLWPGTPTAIMVKSLPESAREGPSIRWNGTESRLTE